MKKYFTLLFFVWAIFMSHSCDKTDDKDINVEAEIIKEMESQQIRSLTACVVKGEEIAWEGTFGHIDINRSTPTTDQSLYTIMSIGKLFLATTVMQLWERGMIDLDADVNLYLPFDVRNPLFPDQKITPHILLNHTSGLAWPEAPDGIPDFHHFYTHGDEPPLIRDWLPEYILPGGSQYRASVWKDFSPGESFLYSNIGASLLGLIVEEISEMDYRDFCKENIFDPLEMNNSAFRLSNLDKDFLVTPYDDNNHPINYYSSRHYPAGFFSSNMEDFSYFVIAMLNDGVFKGNRILEESTMEKMLELQDPTSGTANLWVHCLGDCVGHLGGGTGFSTWAEWHFSEGRALFIFSNKVNGSIEPGGKIYELVKHQALKY